jgi:type 1 glutamine amidotransferase
VKPMAAAVAGAVISGVAMYAVGVRAPQADAFVESPALVQTLDGQYVAMARPASYTTALRPAATPVAERRSTAAAAPRRTVYRTVEPTEEQVVVREEAQPRRSWGKTGLIIGGAAASGAGVGAIVDGKKGALIGAAIGGGAASIYEATRRR